MTDAIPQGFSSVTPHLVIKDCENALEFYKKAFSALEIYRSKMPDGRIMHAMIQIGNSFVMMADEFPDMGAVGPNTLGGTSTALHIYTEDADKLFKQAIDAGAIQIMPLADMFWGDRYGQIQDPYGHRWAIATHTRDVSPEEMEKTAKEIFSKSDFC
ncbi:VOC family protein [Nitrosopumilus piranensis]|uniref:Glyoxalase/bleomycin resistance protein/dioxygenase n=1 Tax=Nitrosopumilus piranensis TaxID=1582439 RepID=A0A0C5BUA2_9ARCH|nr:VOC family protein [Nitrosopumilus piranensis]AJM91774.1 Glyoxalase/bleomycin resistance protein/dioxygenase [Nitrosopumilus piranensis]